MIIITVCFYTNSSTELKCNIYEAISSQNRPNENNLNSYEVHHLKLKATSAFTIESKLTENQLDSSRILSTRINIWQIHTLWSLTFLNEIFNTFITGYNSATIG